LGEQKLGERVITIDNGSVSVDVATGFGPRVVGLAPSGGDNLFVDLPDRSIELGDGRRFRFRGGHRLWLAPEVPEVTYAPDDDPVEVSVDRTTAVVRGVVDGIEKSIALELAADEAAITVDHTLTNQRDRPVRVAPWAISQFRTGGTVLMPLLAAAVEGRGLRPSTRIVGWPYTDWGSLSSTEAGVVRISGTRDAPSKVGTELGRGWLAYVVDGWLFAKYAEAAPSSLDLGATGQVYVDADFVELETLGPLSDLRPGDGAHHREVWRLWPAPPTDREAIEIVESHRP
jgi:hypothetical protein